MARTIVSIGGLATICAVLTIVIYLVYEVLPLFRGADIGAESVFPELVSGTPRLLDVDGEAGVVLRVDAEGGAVFHRLADGAVLAREMLRGISGGALTAIAGDSAGSGYFAAGFDDGSVIIANWRAATGPASDAASPGLVFPFGAQFVQMFEGEAVTALALRMDQGRLGLAGLSAGGGLVWREMQSADPAAGGAPMASSTNPFSMRMEASFAGSAWRSILLPQDPRWLWLVSGSGALSLVETDGRGGGRIAQTVALVEQPRSLTDLRLLAGGVSLLAADDGGNVGQWFMVRGSGPESMRRAREFSLFDGPVAALEVDRNRRAFVAQSENGALALVNVTAETIAQAGTARRAPPAPAARMAALSATGDLLLIEDETGGFSLRRLQNPFPEFSLSALWRPTWYENYSEPAPIWQTASADDTFEPKFSLAPLTFGTLKAALFAMLFAAPLAVCAAVYTGYFMTPALRRGIKPLIELIEALPTVVIGFLAALWLAPLVDAHLAAIALGLLLLPMSALLAGVALRRLPTPYATWLREGWRPMALVPVLLLTGWACALLAPVLESALPGASLGQWLTSRWGVDYVSRNAMIVGVAMGFAVIPAIYSIAEESVFNVPRHLNYGALALGANRWQALVWLVLPAAAPGIISALMIGFGRALGETMIVLMATGNTPVMDMNLFEGMRTLAASLAIEIPESEVGSTHYRILFLASLILLLFSFLINSIAELVRQGLRKRYRMI